MIKLILILAGAFLFMAAAGSQEDGNKNEETMFTPKDEPLHHLKLTILYDNNPFRGGLTCDWGFSCLVETGQETILFDTGTDGKILCANMDTLGIDASSIGSVFLSHQHMDHVGGISSFLARNSRVHVWYLPSFSDETKEIIESEAASAESIPEPRQLAENIYSTGQLEGRVYEQSLILRMKQGLVIITGCAHPGIVNIVEKAMELTGVSPYMVIGGFHLRSGSDEEIAAVISRLKTLGVEKAAPTHCSGDKARELFEKAFGDNYMPVGAGWTITLE
ncbi:MAG: MBL fold metallo-hydrolase [candidate division KSB1 bacterium]|jgi:7,8-dihydropterin-6-yl-methyl-4-(beta-D-ribofuranosyl)aminobenzene 5'-phosphate synthase|nr:MBL fold metallo-hydrolase [candidate division KSB1 bacterium]